MESMSPVGSLESLRATLTKNLSNDLLLPPFQDFSTQQANQFYSYCKASLVYQVKIPSKFLLIL
jgi:hypothetical protein